MEKELLDWLVEHYRENYRYQLEQGDKILDRVSFFTTPLTLLGGGIVYLTTHYLGDPNVWFVRLFYIGIVVAAVLFLVGLVLILSPIIWPHRYSSVLSSGQLQEYVQKLTERERSNVLPTTKENIAQRYSEAATHNGELNEQQRKRIASGTKFCALAVVGFLFSLYPFLRSNSMHEIQPTKVTVETPVSVTYE